MNSPKIVFRRLIAFFRRLFSTQAQSSYGLLAVDTRRSERQLSAEALEPRILYSAAPAPTEAPAVADEAPPAAAEVAPPAVAAPVAVVAPAPAANAIPAEATPPAHGESHISINQGVQLIDADAVNAPLNQQALESVADAARQRWIDSGLTDAQRTALDSLKYGIADLSDNRLGSFEDGTVTLDINGAGLGWFVDATPLIDEEFNISGERLVAGTDSVAAGQVDLLTVLMHEQGHALGIADAEYTSESGNIMLSVLDNGTRLLPESGQSEGALPGSVEGPEYVVTQISPIPAPGYWSDLAVPAQSFTAGAGTDRILLVFVADGRSPSSEVFGGSEDPWGSPAVTNVTFGTSNMTFVGRAIYAKPASGGPTNQNSHNTVVEAWRLTLGSGAAITGDITATGLSTNEPSTQDRFITLLGAVVFDGVDQTTPIDGFVSTTNAPTAASHSLTVASEAGDRVIDAIMVHTGGADVPIGDSQTVIHDLHPDSSSSGNSDHLHTSTEDGAPSVTMDWKWTGSNRSFAHLAFNLNSTGIPHYDFSAATYSANEGDVTNTVTNVTVLRSEVTSIASSVDVVLTNGTATAGSDFTAGPITVNFAAGETSKTIAIQLLGDTTVELDETFGLSFANFSAGGHAGDTNPTATFTILNDDSAVISVNAPSETEGTALGFTVTISNPVDIAVTANRATQDGTATTADNDYTALTSSNVQLFAANSTTVYSVPVSTTADNTVELDETLDLLLSTLAAGGRDVTFSGGGATLTGTGTILNDDSATVSIGDISASEGSPLLFPVTLSNPVDVDTVFNFSTADGTARVVDGDYVVPSTLSVTISAGNTGGTISVSTLNDLFYELDETMTVTLTSVAAAGGRSVSLGSPVTGTGTIIDNDPYTTEVSLNGSTLRVDDVLDFMTDDTITIYTSGTDLIITDPNHTVGTTLSSANARTPDIHTVIVDLSTISFTDFEVRPIAGTDVVTIGTMAGFDAQTLIDGGTDFDRIIHNGGMTLTGSNGVDYIAETIRMNAGSTIATATGDVDFQGNVGTAGSGNFAAVTLRGASITSGSGNVNLVGQGGTTGHYNRGILLEVDLATATASTISTGAAVTLTGTGGGGGIHGNGIEIIAGTVESTGAGPVTLVGTGGAGTWFNHGIAAYKGATIDAGTGILDITGTGATTGSMSRGVHMGGSITLKSAGGNITVDGTGGGGSGSGGMYGMGIELDGVDVDTTGSGTVTLRGTGHAGTLANIGVKLAAATTVNTVNGAISIEGVANGNTLLNHGVQVASGTQVAATGIGAVTILGTSGAGTLLNHGVEIGAFSGISVAGGDLTIAGTSRGTVSLNKGVRIYNSTLTATGIGNIAVSGTGSATANGTFNSGIEISGGSVNTASGKITMTGAGGTGTTYNEGIRIVGATLRSTSGGAIALTGTANGATSGVYNNGVFLMSVTLDSSGSIGVTGTGGGGSLLNHGVFMNTITTPNTVPVPVGTAGAGLYSKATTGNFF